MGINSGELSEMITFDSLKGIRIPKERFTQMNREIQIPPSTFRLSLTCRCYTASSLTFTNTANMDQVMQFVEPGRQFVKDSIRLVKRCTKPDRKEFQKIAMATAIGFAIMGFIGFFVKLIHIPINNIIVGG
ncbi:hypothetical protein KOW79_018691 [Hemibagrus wyckioides]|uniref:Protein transport protein Sec61 subunit gamma n=1 Tax=Hemibagrus wyckioides TaxID=337641 RepID=A0A9D3N7L4_9TELE|nr:hypothetical protein KOW79_018691 [Hemibagrus wyckioides]